MSSAEELEKKAVALHAAGAIKDAYIVLRAGIVQHPDCARMHRLLARACHDQASELLATGAKQGGVVVLREGLDAARRAIELDESSPEAHKWLSILLGKIGDYSSMTDKIKDAYVIKDHAIRAAELDPEDAATQHVLGVWCFQVANVGWIQRKAAEAFFAKPPESSFEEAEQFFLQAEKNMTKEKPFMENRIALGDLYMAIRRLGEAKAWYEYALEFKATNEKDRQLHAETRAKLSKLGYR